VSRRPVRIRPGDLYEDCSYHPCRCLTAEPSGWTRGWRRWLGLIMDIDLTGISLLDGSRRSCSARHCAPVKLTVAEVAERVQAAQGGAGAHAGDGIAGKTRRPG
jgi:hypothetical protein